MRDAVSCRTPEPVARAPCRCTAASNRRRHIRWRVRRRRARGIHRLARSRSCACGYRGPEHSLVGLGVGAAVGWRIDG